MQEWVRNIKDSQRRSSIYLSPWRRKPKQRNRTNIKNLLKNITVKYTLKEHTFTWEYPEELRPRNILVKVLDFKGKEKKIIGNLGKRVHISEGHQNYQIF